MTIPGGPQVIGYIDPVIAQKSGAGAYHLFIQDFANLGVVSPAPRAPISMPGHLGLSVSPYSTVYGCAFELRSGPVYTAPEFSFSGMITKDCPLDFAVNGVLLFDPVWAPLPASAKSGWWMTVSPLTAEGFGATYNPDGRTTVVNSLFPATDALRERA